MPAPMIRLDITLDDPFNIPRWMCAKCGLIFDFQFGREDGENGWPQAIETPGAYWRDEEGDHSEEPEFVEYRCPRCDASFNEKPPVPITVGKLKLEPPDPSTTHFFVEDDISMLVVARIAKQLGKNVTATPLGNSNQVISLYRHSKTVGTWVNCYFMIDGDNQGNPHKGEPNFIHLDKYCMENYLLDFNVCAAISGKPVEQIRIAILNLIKDRREAIFAKSKNKFFEFLFDRLSVDDITDTSLSHLDASEVFPQFVKDIGLKDEKHFVEAYIAHCYSQSRLDALPARLVEAIQGASI